MAMAAQRNWMYLALAACLCVRTVVALERPAPEPMNPPASAAPEQGPTSDPSDTDRAQTAGCDPHPEENDESDNAEPWSIFDCLGSRCGSEDRRDSLRGWLAQGFTWNPANPGDRSNGTLGMNDRSNDYQFNQLGLMWSCPLEEEPADWELGWQVDFLGGSDARFVQSRGFDDTWVSGEFVSWSLPQLYAEIALPGEKFCSLKVGRFWTPLGYEGIPALDRFFYSVTNIYMFAEPSTHWGAMLKYPLADQWTMQAGVVNGWDVWNDNNDSLSFLGTLGWVSEDEANTATFVLYVGDNSDRLQDNQMSYSLMLTRQFTERLSGVLWHDFGCAAEIGPDGSGDDRNAQWYGVAAYLFYEVSDELALGGRVEWFRDEEGVLLHTWKSDALLGPGTLYAATLGLNYAPNLNWTIRPEVRYDWASQVTPFDDETEKQQWTAAVDVVLRF
jgi:hypothetical protein